MSNFHHFFGSGYYRGKPGGGTVIVHDPSYTCHTCDVKDKCLFAFDPYNRDGDCLAVK